MADKTKKKLNMPVIWAVLYTILGCIIVGSLVIFYLVSVNNAHVQGIHEGFDQASKIIKSK